MFNFVDDDDDDDDSCAEVYMQSGLLVLCFKYPCILMLSLFLSEYEF
jgi:hypothetical protein